MNILISGATGFTGRAIVQELEGSCSLRLLDVQAMDTSHDMVVGDVSDLDTVRRAMEGMDALVIAHMHPRTGGEDYPSPTEAFRVNVGGTANLLFAAVETGVQRIALISTLGVLNAVPDDRFLTRDMSMRATGQYYLTKVCEEALAEQYHHAHGIPMAILRPGWIADADSRTDKYGRVIPFNDWKLVDPRDVGEVTRLALGLPDLTYEVFYLSGHPEAGDHCDMAYTQKRLGWQTRHPFRILSAEEQAALHSDDFPQSS